MKIHVNYRTENPRFTGSRNTNATTRKVALSYIALFRVTLSLQPAPTHGSYYQGQHQKKLSAFQVKTHVMDVVLIKYKFNVGSIH